MEIRVSLIEKPKRHASSFDRLSFFVFAAIHGMMPRMPDFSPLSLPDPASLLGHPSLAGRFGPDAAAAAAAAAQIGAANAAAAAAAAAAISTSPSSLSSSSFLDRPTPILDPLAIHKKLLSQTVGGANTPPMPSLYEMAALTHELDTLDLTNKVKELLLANNIGQKVRLRRLWAKAATEHIFYNRSITKNLLGVTIWESLSLYRC
jgi:hypothetical protein